MHTTCTVRRPLYGASMGTPRIFFSPPNPHTVLFNICQLKRQDIVYSIVCLFHTLLIGLKSQRAFIPIDTERIFFRCCVGSYHSFHTWFFFIQHNHQPNIWNLIRVVEFDQLYRISTFTVCSGSSDPFYTVSYCIKRVTASWTYSNKQFCHDQVF